MNGAVLLLGAFLILYAGEASTGQGTQHPNLHPLSALHRHHSGDARSLAPPDMLSLKSRKRWRPRRVGRNLEARSAAHRVNKVAYPPPHEFTGAEPRFLTAMSAPGAVNADLCGRGSCPRTHGRMGLLACRSSSCTTSHHILQARRRVNSTYLRPMCAQQHSRTCSASRGCATAERVRLGTNERLASGHRRRAHIAPICNVARCNVALVLLDMLRASTHRELGAGVPPAP
ncbi:hypothetical protein DFH09DRAFT_1109084 [Mycena vulgaris]|nr:hypothetical protein DFH09DRAFT_1109084 [Mycena vulgaris]